MTNNSELKHYDIVLVLEYFRSVTYYLSIIKHLHRDYTIGIYNVKMDENLLKKNFVAQNLFVKLCIKMGAKLISEKVQTSLLIVPQRPYLDESRDKILSNIIAQETICFLAFAWAGSQKHDKFISEFRRILYY